MGSGARQVSGRHPVKTIAKATKNPQGATWEVTFTGLNPATYKAKVTGTFKNGAKTDTQRVESGSIIVQ